MAKKNANGEGSITKRADGKWMGQVSVGRDPITGKIKRQTFYGKTRDEVRQKITKVQFDIQQGAYIEPSKLTFGEWIDTWLKHYKTASIRPTTLTSYEYIIRIHIKPSIGHIPLKDLKAEQLQAMYNDKFMNGNTTKKGGGLSARTVRYIHVIIHEALAQAQKNDLVIRNVSESTVLPRQTKKEIRVLTLEEQKKFISSLGCEPLGPLFLLALASGMRLGELLALKWSNIDLDKAVVKVKQSLSRVRNFDEDNDVNSELIFQEPKTKAGNRSIPIPLSIIQALRTHKKKQAEQRLKAGASYINNDLVFCTKTGSPIEPRNVDRSFKAILTNAKLADINFHALRHTYATRLLEANEHPKVVQELLGHTSITMTLDLYSHVLPELKSAAAAKINNLFEQEETPSIKESV